MDLRPMTRPAVWLLASLAVAACGDSTGPAGFETVSVQFRVSGTSAGVAGPATAPSRIAGPPLVLEGSNGTLTIDEIRVVVAEIELHTADGACASHSESEAQTVSGPSASDDGGDDCGEFEAPPTFVDLALDQQPVEVSTSMVPAGTYDRLDFDIEDLEDDEGDSDLASAIAAVRTEILAEFPDWPRKASALVVGSFTPTGGSATDFRVYIDAEIEVEMDLSPVLVIDEGGAASRAITVDVSPQVWFAGSGGEVLDLTAFDWDATGQLLELEVEMEHGFLEVEIED